MIKLKDILLEAEDPQEPEEGPKEPKTKIPKSPFEEDDNEGKMAKFDAKELAQDSIAVYKMIQSSDDLPEWLEAKITKAADYMNSVKDYLEHHHSGKNEGKVNEKFNIKSPGYSSQEAKDIVNDALKKYSKDLKQLQYRVIKDWMSKAKAGVIDFFDLVRGFQTGDAKRANPYEVDFLMSVLSKDKIIDRFRKYFGGKKGKRIR